MPSIMRLKLRSALPVSLTVILLLAAGGAPAHAEVPGRYVVAQNINIDPRGSGFIAASCANGHSATGGGYSFGSTTGMSLGSSYPSDPNQDWRTSIRNSTLSAQPFITYAVCARVASRSIQANSAVIQPGAQGSATAICPAGTRLVGGGMAGADSHENDALVVDTSRPTSNGWFVHAYNANWIARSVSAYAVCATWFPPITTVSSNFTVRAGQGWDTVATCPAGTTGLGGGWSFASTTGLVIDISRPSTFSQGWHVHAYNTTAASRTITAWATCA